MNSNDWQMSKREEGFWAGLIVGLIAGSLMVLSIFKEYLL